MGNNTTRQEPEQTNKYPTGKHHPARLIFGGVLLVGALVVALIIGGQMLLGNKSPALEASPVSSLDQGEGLLAFAQCMRDNGVPDFPDPDGGGINLNGTGIDRNTPEFQAAHKACEPLLPAHPVQGAAGDSPWERITPGGETMCADGSAYAFFERQADPANVVFYLDGGGICFDAASCANANTPGSGERAGPDYDPTIEGENPATEGGMFDFTRDENPFQNYSFIYVPLCTADAHIGNATREYSPGLTVEHKGFVNGTAALSYLSAHYPNAARLVVVGKTAGSFAAPLYAGLAADLLPAAQVMVFGAQSGAFPDDPDLNARVIGEQWGAYASMPGWEVNEGLTAHDWGAQRFWIQAGLHDPGILLARFDYAFDPHAVEALKYMFPDGVNANTLALIDANEAAIEAAGVILHSYTAPGDGHGILEFELFYTLEVNGVKLVDWIAALIGGEPLADIHCVNCEG